MKITNKPFKTKYLSNNNLWGFYLNYEELKQETTQTPHLESLSFYLNYEELKLFRLDISLFFDRCFYLNYEELKLQGKSVFAFRR